MQFKELLSDLVCQSNKPTFAVYYNLLKEFGCSKLLAGGKWVHSYIITSKIGEEGIIGDYLVQMYDNCGSILDLEKLIDRRPDSSQIALNRIAGAYAKQGRRKASFQILIKMQIDGIKINGATLVTFLNVCSSHVALGVGKWVHAYIVGIESQPSIIVSNAILNMYKNCGCILHTKSVFDRISNKNVVTWASMIAAYSQCGYYTEALHHFWRMKDEGLKPNKIVYVCVLNSCVCSIALQEGMLIHACIIADSVESDTIVGTALVSMYAKCGSISAAYSVFDEMIKYDIIAWNTMMMVCAEYGHYQEAISLFNHMHLSGLQPDQITFITVFDACSLPSAFSDGKRMHAHYINSGLKPHVNIGNALLKLYDSYGSLVEAQKVFDQMKEKDVVSWTALIAVHANYGFKKHSIRCFKEMHATGVKPNQITFITVLDILALEEGKLIHAFILKRRLETELLVSTALLNMYGNTGMVNDAHILFVRIKECDIIAWNSMITAFGNCGHAKSAMQYFYQMQMEGMKPDKYTFIGIFNGCSSPAELADGKLLHSHAISNLLAADTFVVNALLNLYGKCECLHDVSLVFDNLLHKDVVSWNLAVAAYVHYGYPEKALKVFHNMFEQLILPDKVSFINALSACNNFRTLAEGRLIHASIIGNEYVLDVAVCNSLINMYGKCESIDEANRIFNEIPQRDVSSWNTMIGIYNQNGHGNGALILFQEMEDRDIEPDIVTFVTILDVCATLAALDRGKHVHNMINEQRMDAVVALPLLNMYSKCGCLDDAQRVFDKMEEHGLFSWNCMISSYAQHGNAKQALHLFQLMQQDIKPDKITFIGILCACSYAGLVNEGHNYFVSMSRDHGVAPAVEHYGCLIDMFGRAGHLDYVEDFIQVIPFQDSTIVWIMLLGACRNYNNEKQGQYASERILELDPYNSAAYTTLSNIYARHIPLATSSLMMLQCSLEHPNHIT